MASTVLAGKAVVEAGVKDNTQKGIEAIKKRFKSMSRSLSKISAKTAVAAAAIGAPLIASVRKFISVGDALEKMAIRTGFTVETLSKLSYAAQRSGTDIEQLGAAIFRANRRLGNFKTGTGPAARALNELGLSYRKLRDLSPEDRFFAMVDALKNMDDAVRANQLGFEIFGDNWKSLLPLFDLGSNGIKNLMEKAKSLGLEISTETAAAAAGLSDKLLNLTSQVLALSVKIGSALGPALANLLKAFNPVLSNFIKLIEESPELILSIGKLALALAGISTAFAGISAVLAVSNPFVLATVAILAGVAALTKYNDLMEISKKMFANSQFRQWQEEAARKAHEQWAGKDPGRQRSPEEIAKDQAAASELAGGNGGGIFGKKTANEAAAETKKREKKQGNQILTGIGNLFVSGTQMVGNAITTGSTVAAHAITGVGQMAEAANIPMISSTAGAMGTQALGLRGSGSATSAEQMLSLQRSSSAHLASINVNIQGIRNEGINTEEE